MSVTFSDFGRTSGGKRVRQATLKSDRLEVRVLDFGAIITNLIVPDRRGVPTDVVLGYPTVPDYELNPTDCMGAAVGRYAGRIGGARFLLDGLEYTLTANQNGNCLHSGLNGLQRTLFKMAATEGTPDSVTLTATVPDGADGFPGELEVEIQYSLAGSGLVIQYGAATDKPTVVNLTSHSYFNLNGHASGSVLGHRLCMPCKEYLELDAASLPTGRLVPAGGTPMDFTEEKTLGRDIDADYEALKLAQGYDHCFVIPDSGLRHALWLEGPETGIRMEVLTTLPGVLVYTANYLAPATPCKGGASYRRRDAVCLETGDYPDAPNHPDFPDTTVRPGVPYSATTLYRFETNS